MSGLMAQEKELLQKSIDELKDVKPERRKEIGKWKKIEINAKMKIEEEKFQESENEQEKALLEEKEEFSDKITAQDEKEEKRFAMTSRQKYLFQEAKKLISEIAIKENLQEQFLITSSDLKRTICEKDNFNKIVSGWRHQVFGKELEHLIFQ